jgi:hypothetical protein
MPVTPIGLVGTDLTQIASGQLDPGVLPAKTVFNDGSTPFVAPQTGVDPTAPTHLTTVEWVEANVGSAAWQGVVLSATTAVQPTHVAGARYILPPGASGAAWTGQPTGTLAIDSGSAWSFLTPLTGYTAFVTDVLCFQVYYSGAWARLDTTVGHGNLAGLQGGTTGQYYHLTSSQATALTGSQAAHTAYMAPLSTTGTPGFRVIDGTDIRTGVVASAQGGLGINAAAGSGYLKWATGTPSFESGVPWGDLTGVPSTFPPSAHSSTHGVSGSDPVSLDASQVATGTLALARGGLGVSGSSVGANYAFIGPNGSSGAATFRALTPSDISGWSAGGQVVGRLPDNSASVWLDLSTIYVPLSRQINTLSGSGLTGGGNLSSNLSLSWTGVIVQQATTVISTRQVLNFTGTGVTVTDDPGNSSADIAIPGVSMDPLIAVLVFG